MLRLILVGLMLVSFSVSYADPYERAGWPGEGVPVVIATQNSLMLFSQPEKVGKTIEIPYRRDWLVPFDKSLVRTIKSEFVVAKRSESVEIWCGKTEQYAFSAGDEIEVLQYRAEGYYVARVNDRVCDVPIYSRNNLFETIPNPEIEWWVRATYADGSSPGWLLVEEKQIRFGRRRF